MDIVRDAAQYVKQGFLIVPLYGINEVGDCTCRKGKECGRSSGKHPRIKKWQDNATNDLTTIKHWLKKWPNMNLGVRLGPEVDLVDIEYDTSEGRKTAERLLSNVNTPTFTSARSIHRLFRYPDGFKPAKAITTIDGLEIRFGTEKKGAQSVLPPSKHFSGVHYDWISGRSLQKTPIAAFPECVLKLIVGGDANSSNGGLDVDIQKAKDVVVKAQSNGSA